MQVLRQALDEELGFGISNRDSTKALLLLKNGAPADGYFFQRFVFPEKPIPLFQYAAQHQKPLILEKMLAVLQTTPIPQARSAAGAGPTRLDAMLGRMTRDEQQGLIHDVVRCGSVKALEILLAAPALAGKTRELLTRPLPAWEAAARPIPETRRSAIHFAVQSGNPAMIDFVAAQPGVDLNDTCTLEIPRMEPDDPALPATMAYSPPFLQLLSSWSVATQKEKRVAHLLSKPGLDLKRRGYAPVVSQTRHPDAYVSALDMAFAFPSQHAAIIPQLLAHQSASLSRDEAGKYLELLALALQAGASPETASRLRQIRAQLRQAVAP